MNFWGWILWLAAGVAAFGQVTAGSVSGFVLDPSGKPLPNARILATDTLHSDQREASSDRTGYYRIAELPASVYKLGVTAAGFEELAVDGVGVTVNSNVRVDCTLRIAGLKETIEVRARVLAVETESPELSAVFDQSLISRLPLNERDFLQLSLLSSGVVPPVQGSELSTRGLFAMHANGGREEFNNFLLDGVDNNDPDTNGFVLQPPVDSIQEFKIETNAYGAEYGRNGGGQVNVVTRRGSNEWHGFGYEYLRNRALDWPNYFDNGQKAEYIRNQFGTGAGGPAIRNRLFLFGTFDGLRGRQGTSRLGVVPSAAERTGDLSDLGVPVIDPFTGDPFANNQIPKTRISPIASRILNLYPPANRAGDSGNFLGQPVGTDSQTQSSIRTDYMATSKDQVTARYTIGTRELFEPFAEQSTDVPGFGDYPTDHGHNAMLHHEHTFSSRTIQSLRLGFNRGTRQILPQNYQVDVNRLWGVGYLPTEARNFGYPSITIAGLSHIGDVASLPIRRADTTYQLTEGLSMVRGNHLLKLGADVRNIRHNGDLQLLSRGSLSFSGDISGSGVSDLLLGYPVFTMQSQSNNLQTLRTTQYNAFVQDDWKVRSGFTLNLGLRYEFNTAPTDPTNRMSLFDLSTMTLEPVGTHGISRSGIRPDGNNFAPRIGFAWNFNPGTVLRGGYGLFYDASMLMVNTSAYFNPPYFNIRVFFPTADSLLTLDAPFPMAGGLIPPASLSSISPDLTAAYLQHWNLNLQREVKGLGTLTLAYAGSKGTHLIRSRDLNQPFPGPGALEERRPYPEFSNIFYTESGGNSSYNALEVTLSRPLARGISLRAVYTFSKSIDDTSAFLATVADRNFPQNSHDYRAERGPSSFDMTHRLVIAYLQRFPGRSWWNRNFETSGIVVVQSGQPFTPVLQFDNSNTGNTGGNFGSDRPDVVADPGLANPGPDAWFNPSVFAIPVPNTFGNAGRNILRGPGLATVDVSLSRRFRMSDRAWLRFEIQAFNLLNRTNFDLPQSLADDPTSFGKIFSAKSPRQLQAAARVTF